MKTLSYIADAGVHGNFCLDMQIRDDVTIASGSLLDVLVLHELESFTQSLENSIEHPLDWRPSLGQKTSIAPLELTLEFTQGSLLERSTVMLPVNVLPQLAAWKMGEVINLRDMYWIPVSSTLCLSKLQLSAEEHADLGEGALVILPESFESVWSTTLHVANGGLALEGEYQWPDDVWLQQTKVAEQKTADAIVVDSIDSHTDKSLPTKKNGTTYCVQFEFQIDPVALMQPATPVKPGLREMLASESGDSELWLRNDNGDQFRGQLLALGAGQAVLLQKQEAVVR